MDDPLYRTLKRIAIGLAVVFGGFLLYEAAGDIGDPVDQRYRAGERLFQDGHYARALAAFRETLAEAPDHAAAHRGLSRTLMQLGRNEEALAAFSEAIALAPDVAATYANRGILHDRLGQYEAAVSDYERALTLDPELADGPGLITRFLRNQAERPPSIADRLNYLKSELAKPPSERVLTIPEVDAEQRPYKL